MSSQNQETPQVYRLSEEYAGARLDSVVASLCGISREAAAKLIAARRVRIDDHPARKSDRPAVGARICVEYSPTPSRGVIPTPVDMRIVYSDEDIIVVNKPVGLAAHPTAGWEGPTVVGALVAQGFSLAPGVSAERPGIVQRLDVGTSGVMVVAASSRAYEVLQRAFYDRSVEKIYHALLQGHVDPLSGTIAAPIGRHPSLGWRFAVVDGGREAITRYRTLEVFSSTSLVSVRLETGRTHQIRVHFSALNHPCCGDSMYGADVELSRALGLNHQWLHACSLALTHPRTGQSMTFTADYPPDLVRALDVARQA